MSSVEEICWELQKTDNSIDSIAGHLDRESNEIYKMMNKAQGSFGTTQEGQNLIQSLDTARSQLMTASAVLCSLRTSIRNNINRIRK